MKPKKQFSPQNLRAILAFLLVLLLAGTSALFYLGLTTVREFAVTVNHRLADAEASEKQVGELKTLKDQLAQSNALVQKANQLFANPASYQSQVLTDVRRYAEYAGLQISNTTFDTNEATGARSITITVANPVSYRGLITFLNNVEKSLPKLQVSSISLGHTAGGKADTVTVEEIKIDVSVR